MTGENKRLHRFTYSTLHIEAFFEWTERQFELQGLTPTRPFTQALEYARERRLGLEVFLIDPDVPLDTITGSAAARSRRASGSWIPLDRHARQP